MHKKEGRYDKILGKMKEQGRRIAAILSAMEKQQRTKR